MVMFDTELSDALDCLNYFLSRHYQHDTKEVWKLEDLKRIVIIRRGSEREREAYISR